MSIGTGLTALVRSLLTASVSAKNRSIVFSVMTILIVVGTSVAGPIYSETFSAGLRLGSAWYGLPFLVCGGMIAIAFVMELFIRERHAPEQDEQDSDNLI